VAQSAANITPEAWFVNKAGIYPGEKEMKKIIFVRRSEGAIPGKII
jgi:hypothetical protein